MPSVTDMETNMTLKDNTSLPGNVSDTQGMVEPAAHETDNERQCLPLLFEHDQTSNKTTQYHSQSHSNTAVIETASCPARHNTLVAAHLPAYQPMPAKVSSSLCHDQVQQVPLDLTLSKERAVTNTDLIARPSHENNDKTGRYRDTMSHDLQNVGCVHPGFHRPYNIAIPDPPQRVVALHVHPPSRCDHVRSYEPNNQYNSWLHLREKSAFSVVSPSTFGQIPSRLDLHCQDRERMIATSSFENHLSVHRPIPVYPGRGFMPFSTDATMIDNIGAKFAETSGRLLPDQTGATVSSIHMSPLAHSLNYHPNDSNYIALPDRHNGITNVAINTSKRPYLYNMNSQTNVPMPCSTLPISQANLFSHSASFPLRQGQHPNDQSGCGAGPWHSPASWDCYCSPKTDRDCLVQQPSPGDMFYPLSRRATNCMADHFIKETRGSGSSQLTNDPYHPTLMPLARGSTDVIEMNQQTEDRVSKPKKSPFTQTRGLHSQQQLPQEILPNPGMSSHTAGNDSLPPSGNDSLLRSEKNGLPGSVPLSYSPCTVPGVTDGLRTTCSRAHSQQQPSIPTASLNQEYGRRKRKLSPSKFAEDDTILNDSTRSFSKNQHHSLKTCNNTGLGTCRDRGEHNRTAVDINPRSNKNAVRNQKDIFCTSNKISNVMTATIDERTTGLQEPEWTDESRCNEESYFKRSPRTLVLRDRNVGVASVVTASRVDGRHQTINDSHFFFRQNSTASGSGSTMLACSSVFVPAQTEFAEANKAKEHRKDKDNTSFFCKKCKYVCRSFAELLHHHSTGCFTPPRHQPVHAYDCLGKRGVDDTGLAGTECQCTQCPMCKGMFGSMFRVFCHLQRGCYRKANPRVFQAADLDNETCQAPLSGTGNLSTLSQLFKSTHGNSSSAMQNLQSEKKTSKNAHAANKSKHMRTRLNAREISHQHSFRVAQQPHILHSNYKHTLQMTNGNANSEISTGNHLTKTRSFIAKKSIGADDLRYQTIGVNNASLARKRTEAKYTCTNTKDDLNYQNKMCTSDGETTTGDRKEDDGEIKVASVHLDTTVASPACNASHEHLQGSSAHTHRYGDHVVTQASHDDMTEDLTTHIENSVSHSETQHTNQQMPEELKNLVKQEIQENLEAEDNISGEVLPTLTEVVAKQDTELSLPTATVWPISKHAGRARLDGVENWTFGFGNTHDTRQETATQITVTNSVGDVQNTSIKSVSIHEDDKVNSCRRGLFSGEIFPPSRLSSSLAGSQPVCQREKSLKYPSKEHKDVATSKERNTTAYLKHRDEDEHNVSKSNLRPHNVNPRASWECNFVKPNVDPNSGKPKDHFKSTESFRRNTDLMSCLPRETTLDKVVGDAVQYKRDHIYSASRNQFDHLANQTLDDPDKITRPEMSSATSGYMDDKTETEVECARTPDWRPAFHRSPHPDQAQNQGRLSTAIAFGESRRTRKSGVRERIVYALDADNKPVMLVEREGEDSSTARVKSMMTCSRCSKTFPTLFLFLWHQNNTCRQSD